MCLITMLSQSDTIYNQFDLNAFAKIWDPIHYIKTFEKYFNELNFCMHILIFSLDEL
jgi:hypothetical protein